MDLKRLQALHTVTKKGKNVEKLMKNIFNEVGIKIERKNSFVLIFCSNLKKVKH